jgi:capsular polysaccharide biosynthesis protein
VIRKLLEAFFRHKLLLLLPPILVPAIVTPIAMMSMPTVYETAVGVWVDTPAYLNYNNGFSPWMSPSQNQSTRINELLHTRAFLLDVAQRTPSLAPLVGNAAGETRLTDIIGRSVAIGGNNGGDHLLLIRVQAPTARLAYELCTALVQAYQEKSAADVADQTDSAIQFYQGRSDEAQQRLTKATQDLRRYVASRQPDGASSGDPNQLTIPNSLLDPRLSALQTGLQQAQSDYNSAQSVLDQAQKNAVAASQGQQVGFQVLDEPQVPTAPISQAKKLMIYPIAAAVGGLGVSGLLLVLLVMADRSVRSESDLAPGLRVLGVLPSLHVRRVPKKLRAVATRRAIGATAGAALPAPGGAK